MKKVANSYHVVPSSSVVPGVVREPDGIRFTVVIRRGTRMREQKEPCLILIRTDLQTAVTIPLTEQYRIGDLYSCKVIGLSAGHLAYCYKIGEYYFNDPCASSLGAPGNSFFKESRLSTISETLSETGVSPLRGKYGNADRFVYLLHVRGFTMAHGSGVSRSHRGTFAGVTDKIPYLKELGVTTVELMPICELTTGKSGAGRGYQSPFCLPVKRDETADNDSQNSFQKSSGVDSLTPESSARVNYWGFGSAYYYAPAYRLTVPGTCPSREYLTMIEALHRAGMEVVQQFWFPHGISATAVTEVSRYYVRHFGIDGIHVIGADIPLAQLTKDAILADTQIYSDHAAEARNKDMSAENYVLSMQLSPDCRGSATASAGNLMQTGEDYLYLVRRFVKADDLVLSDFIAQFLHVPEGIGELRFAANYRGLTLADTVTYSRKHNEGNGEDNRDGTDNNASWNCGVEGPSRKKEVQQLRKRLIRNMLTLVLLSQGTPMLMAGDERGNSQMGNNNPYCQDNEIGWTDWKNTRESQHLLAFTRQLSAFRRTHPVFRKTEPFRFTDYRALGYPDLSYHGRDAWKADFSGYSHSIGLLFCEDYEEAQTEQALRTGRRHLLYLALNMYWQEMTFGLPNLPAGECWYRIMDTSREDPFLPDAEKEPNLHQVTVKARTIVILTNRSSEKA